MNKETKSVLVPVRFISLMLHVIATTMLYFSYADNVVGSYPFLTSTTDTLFVGGRTSFLAANTLTIIFLAVEMALLFSGRNLFKEGLAVVNSTVHIVGCIMYVAYGFALWQFDTLWGLWAVFSLFPLSLEIFSLYAI